MPLANQFINRDQSTKADHERLEIERRERELRAGLRAHERPAESEDETVLLEGEMFSRAEKKAFRKYCSRMTWKQYLVVQTISFRLALRHSFIDGNIRKGLTLMAAYCVISEFVEDFSHCTPDIVVTAFSFLGSKHAVGFLALSHLSEMYKEKLEAEEQPAYHLEEEIRRDTFRALFAEDCDPTWPEYIKKYHETWDKVRGDLPQMEPPGKLQNSD